MADLFYRDGRFFDVADGESLPMELVYQIKCRCGCGGLVWQRVGAATEQTIKFLQTLEQEQIRG